MSLGWIAQTHHLHYITANRESKSFLLSTTPSFTHLVRMPWRAHDKYNCHQKDQSINTESDPGHTAGFVSFLHLRWELEVIRTAGSFAGSLVDCSAVYRFRFFLCWGFFCGSAGRRAAAAAAKGAVRRLALTGISIGYLEIGRR